MASLLAAFIAIIVMIMEIWANCKTIEIVRQQNDQGTYEI